MSSHLVRLVELAKNAPKHADRIRSLAKHFESLAEEVDRNGMSEEKLLIGSQRQLVEDVLREIIPWQHEVVACARCVSEAERIAVLRILRRLTQDDNTTIAYTGEPINDRHPSADPESPIDHLKRP